MPGRGVTLLKRWINLALALLLGGVTTESFAQDAGQPARQPGGKSESASHFAFMLKIYDPEKFLSDDVKVKVIGIKSGEMIEEIATDTGGAADEDAGDRIFSTLINRATEAELKLELGSGGKRWDTKVTLEYKVGRPINVVLALGKNGEVKRTTLNRILSQRSSITVAPTAGGSTSTKESPGANLGDSAEGASAGEDTSGNGEDSTSRKEGWLLQALGFTALGFLLAAISRFSRHRGQRMARLDLDQENAEPVLPARLDASQVPALLAGPLARHRVVLIGPDLDTPADNIIRCLDSETSPEELVRAVEAMSVRAGLPPALLVADTEQLYSPITGNPATHLAQRVARRFPLYVVDGPSAWRAWVQGSSKEMKG